MPSPSIYRPNYDHIAKDIILPLLTTLNSTDTSGHMRKQSPAMAKQILAPIQWAATYCEATVLLTTTKDNGLVGDQVVAMMSKLQALPSLGKIEIANLLIKKMLFDQAICLTHDVDPSQLLSANTFLYLINSMPSVAWQRKYMSKFNELCRVSRPEEGAIQIAIRMGSFELALHWIGQAESLHPNNASLLKEKCLALMGAWRHEEALNIVRAEGGEKPMPFHRTLEGLLLERTGHVQESLEVFASILTDSRYGHAATLHTALLMRSQNQTDAAISALQAMLPVTKDWRAYFELGICHLLTKAGNEKMAIRCFEKGASLFPDRGDNLCLLMRDLFQMRSAEKTSDFLLSCEAMMTGCAMPFFHEYLALPAYLGMLRAMICNPKESPLLLQHLLAYPSAVFSSFSCELSDQLNSLTAYNLHSLTDLLSKAIFPWHATSLFERYFFPRLESLLATK